MNSSKSAASVFRRRRRTIIVLIFLAAGATLLYFLLFRTATLGPIAEKKRMAQLEAAKPHYELKAFESDGCSFNISQGWSTSVKGLSKISPAIAERYANAENIPFEEACIQHDKIYHKGEGGYGRRLQADNALRAEIISYGINNTEEIKRRTNLSTNEEAIFLYETIAEAVYYAVRVGGAPCTGMPYAWGFGYGSGVCTSP